MQEKAIKKENGNQERPKAQLAAQKYPFILFLIAFLKLEVWKEEYPFGNNQ